MGLPEGTRPWRKAWRKRWRDGSSYRQLSLLQREVLRWIEENSDDEGKVTTTSDYLAQMMSAPRHRVSRSSAHCAVHALVDAGQVIVHDAGQNTGHAPMTLVRVRFREYQEQDSDAGQMTGQVTGHEPGSSSRGRQKKAEKKAPRGAPDPRHAPLVSRLVAVFAEVKGTPYAFQAGKDAAAVKALLSFGDDAEIEARWRKGLQLGARWPGCHTFAELRAKWNNLAGAPAVVAPLPGIPEFR